MSLDNRQKAGLLFFVGAVQFSIFLMIAAAVDPTYSIHSNHISDLGVRAGAPFFNGSIIVLGLLVIGGAFFFDRAFRKRWLTVLLIVTGIGAAGVGVFNLNFPIPHYTSALIAFSGAGVSAIATSRVTKPPLAYLSIVLGVISLISLPLYLASFNFGGPDFGIGVGGLERMIVLPILGWLTGFGGYLMASAAGTEAKQVM